MLEITALSVLVLKHETVNCIFPDKNIKRRKLSCHARKGICSSKM